jgi:hypothetical protein
MKKQKVLSSETEYQGLFKPPELDELAKSIKARANAMRQRDKTNLQDALAQGAELTRVKELLPRRRGEFGVWCRMHEDGISPEMIRVWMRLHQYRSVLTQNGTVTVLTINQARKVIQQHLASLKPSKPKPETETVKLCEIAINKAKELLPVLNNRLGSSCFKNIEQVIEYTIDKEWSHFNNQDASCNHFSGMQEAQIQA